MLKNAVWERECTVKALFKTHQLKHNKETHVCSSCWVLYLSHDTSLHHLMSRPDFSFNSYVFEAFFFFFFLNCAACEFLSDLIWRDEVTMKEGKWLLLLLCVWLVPSANAVVACPWTWVMDTGRLSLFSLKWRLTVEFPQMLVLSECRAACCFLPIGLRLGCDQFMFLRADVDISDHLYGSPGLQI